ncbi:hypothetical protein BO94DRAFT_587470 [Aspergillus sclerotioniger CBS 115572]|uniref:DUF7600 domain-containing protein n=1 Tax=Aspergillus sclerotioniger CBS 115572 TaxID=1450535 RepID=A0A317W5Z2_9EURO|nr:hypothetical protein BO94DRAFT_587470 [Aspergillus sclerotioniger CBS 115572]PWY81763.1 hypothetical protein BO94DRAFT_587470 [Aspergillus sclerotioniger CBS 115572]
MLHCTICGVVISPAHWAPEQVYGGEWHKALCIVRREGTEAPAWLRGVGYTNYQDEIFVPLEGDDLLSPCRGLPPYGRFFDPDTGCWTFPFHAACWDILLQRIPEAASNISRVATILYNVFYCTPWSPDGFLQPGHDFEGAARFQDPRWNPVSTMKSRGYANLLASPSRLSSLEGIVRPAEDRSAPSLVIRRFAMIDDIFARLPVEVLVTVLTYLPSSSVACLRLASRSVACATNPTSLPQHFWKSRFLPSFEMGFALPTDTNGRQDWRDTYFTIKAALSHDHAYDGLKSRRRIWKIVSVNAILIEQHMSDVVLCGHSCSRDDSLASQSDSDAVQRLSTRFVTTQLTTNTLGLLQSGSRNMFGRTMLVPVMKGAITLVEFATVSFNSRVFISGFRFTLDDAVAGNQKTRCLGYTSYTMQPVASPSALERVVAFDLAICAGGLVGVRLVLQSGSGTNRTGWVGGADPNGADVVFGEMFWGKAVDQIGIVASFDAFKMVAFGINDGKLPGTGHSQSGRPLPIWTPSFPTETSRLCPEPQPLEYQKFNRFLNIDFGGVHVRRIAHLTRIVAHMFTPEAPLLLTNFENEVTFKANQLADISAFTRPFAEPENIQYTKKTLRAPNGYSISGFTSVLEATSGSFQTFGLQCGKEDGNLLPRGDLPMLPLDSRTSPADLPSFKGVKLVCFSRGCHGRPRRSDEISGLWLEYNNDSRPCIVGQWISETETFTLEPGETITGITVWLSKCRVYFSKKYPLGRVVRIAISTPTRCKVCSLGGTPKGSQHMILKFKDNRLEELSQLIWSFNDCWDLPYVTLTTKVASDHLSLWDPLDLCAGRPLMCPERVFWKSNEDTNSLLSIACFTSSGKSCFSGLEDRRRIVGIRVTYESGHSFDLGTVSGTTMFPELSFDPDDCITQIELFRDNLGLNDVSFSAMNTRSKRCTTKRFDDPSGFPLGTIGRNVHYTINFAQRKCWWAFVPTEKFDPVGPSYQNDLLQGEVIGLYVVSVFEQGLYIGLLLYQKGSE